MKPNRDDSRILVEGTKTAFEILVVLDELQEATLTEVTEHVPLSRPGVYKHLTTLDELGYVVKEDGIYSLSPRFLRFGNTRLNSTPLYRVAKPKIDELSDTTSGLASLVVEDHSQGVYAYRTGKDEYLFERPAGEVVPLHASAAGKALLAFRDDSSVESLVEGDSFSKETPDTITDPATLRSELKDIREGGIASDSGECVEGWHSVAYPIMHEETIPVGAVSVSGPTDEIPVWTLQEEIAGQIVSTAKSIEVDLFKD